VRADGVISSIKSNASPMSTSRIPSDEAVVVVIELNSGRTHDLDIEPGNRVHASMLTTPTHH
jgi:uncharacterized membrane protein (UPF0127 family)